MMVSPAVQFGMMWGLAWAPVLEFLEPAFKEPEQKQKQEREEKE